MADVLKHRTNGLVDCLLPQQQILDLPQRPTLPVIHKVIPTARIAVQHRRRLHPLPSVRLTPLALERVVCIARRTGLELEQLPQTIEREMPFNIFGGIHDA